MTATAAIDLIIYTGHNERRLCSSLLLTTYLRASLFQIRCNLTQMVVA